MACSPSLPWQLNRWVGMRFTACTHLVANWMNEMAWWIKSRSYADCHKFITQHDDKLVPILIFFERLLALARYTAIPSCFLLFE